MQDAVILYTLLHIGIVFLALSDWLCRSLLKCCHGAIVSLQDRTEISNMLYILKETRDFVYHRFL